MFTDVVCASLLTMCLILTQDTLHRPPAKEIRLEDHCDYK